MGHQQLDEMLKTIEAMCRYTQGYTRIQSFKPEVMAASASVPREEFVPKYQKQ